MKVLMFSLDRKVLLKNSPQQERMLRYGTTFEELHVVLSQCSSRLPRCIRIASNIFIYPTNHLFRYNPLYFWHAFYIGREIAKINAFDVHRDVITAQDAFPTGVVGYALKKALGLRLQIQVHIDFFNPRFRKESLLHEIYFRCAYFFLPRADAIRVVSHVIRNYLVEIMHINSGKIVVLPICTDKGRAIYSSPVIVARARYFGYSFFALMLCRFVRQKNIDCAVRALRIIAADCPDVALILVGSGPEERHVRHAVCAAGIIDRVFFVPWTHDAVSYYRAADVFLLPSWYEGWGLTVPEAMASGLPVIATSVGCVPELIQSGHNGFVIRDNSAEDMAEALRTLRNNPARRARMGKAAQAVVFERLPDIADYPIAYKKALQYVFRT